MNNKFKKVNEALMNKTRLTGNYVRLTKNTNCSHKGKYAIQNVVTNNTYGISFKTLDEVIKEYNLKFDYTLCYTCIIKLKKVR